MASFGFMLNVALHLIPKKAIDNENATAKPVLAPLIPKPATTKPTSPKPASPKPASPKPALPKPASPKKASPKLATPKPATPKPATSHTVETTVVAAPAEDPPKLELELTWTDMEDATIIGMKALNKSWKEIGTAIPEKHTEDLRARYESFNIRKNKGKEDKQTVSNAIGLKVGENNVEAKEAAEMKQAKEKRRKEKKSRDLSEEAKENNFREMNAKAQKAKAEAAKWEAEVAKAKPGTTGSKGKARQTKSKDAHGKELKGILKKTRSSRKEPSRQAPTSHQLLPLLFVGDADGLTADEVIMCILVKTEPRLTICTKADDLISTSSGN